MNVKEKLKSAHGEGAITDEALEEMRDRVAHLRAREEGTKSIRWSERNWKEDR